MNDLGGNPNDFRRSFRWCKSHVCIFTGSIVTSDHFSKSAQTRENMMFVKSTTDYLGDAQESLEMPWSVSKCSRMIPDDCNILPCAPVRGECFAPPPSPRGSAPSIFSMFATHSGLSAIKDIRTVHVDVTPHAMSSRILSMHLHVHEVTCSSTRSCQVC